MTIFRDVSIKRKLTLITMLTSIVALLLAVVGYSTYELVTFRQAMRRNLLTLAQLTGAHSTAELAFDDSRAAASTLRALSAVEHIVSACLYKKDGQLFAEYYRRGVRGDDSSHCHRSEAGNLLLSLEIVFDRETIGTLYLQSDMREFYSRLARYAGISGIVMVAASIVGFLLSAQLQRVISKPILDLTETARVVSDKKDYSVRAVKHGQDEVGFLIEAFNEMLAQIQARDATLTEMSKNLEQLYRLSTAMQEPLSLREQLGRVLEAARQVVLIDRFCIWSVTAAGDKLTGLAGAGFSAQEWRELEEAEVPLAEAGAMHKALREGISLVFNERNPLPPELRLKPPYSELKGLRAKSFLLVPMIARGRTVGLLSVDNKVSRKPIGPQTLELLQIFAAHAAIALENGRLYGELRAALKEVETSQQRLIQTERLRALGEMAAGVAHDFNNLLAVILMRAEILMERGRDSGMVQGLETIRRAALDGAQTIRRIQEFTRTRRTRPFGRVDLSELLKDVVELTRPRWKDEAYSRGVTYEVHVEGGPVPPVAGIAEELNEVFTNLLINAIEAMPSGGQCIFRVAVDGDWAMVRVHDIGCGMSEESRQRVFEPFYTTKGPRGTGLGLAVAWGIITRHGGTVEIDSALGVGSTFTVRLPLSQEFLPEETREPVSRPPRAARVLLIEDEPGVRAVLSDLLVSRGYRVLEASDGEEGLARCKAEPVDLILTDLSMPGMSGWEVAAAAQALFPQVPVGFITGWGDQLDPNRLERHQVRFVLAKPVTAEDVLRKLGEILSATKASESSPKPS